MHQSMTATGSSAITDSRRSAGAQIATTATKRLLICGVAAGPLFLLSGLAQAFTRPGFDITRHALSLLSLGDRGWMQIATFLIAGPLAIAGAIGMRRAMRGISGGRWAPALVGVFGVGVTAAGFFHADPSRGFPPGSPAGATGVSTWHGMMHLACGSVAFLALIAASFVLARYFAVRGRRGSAIFSCIAGVVFALGLANGSGPAGSLTLLIGVAVAWLWVALTDLRLIAESSKVASTP